MGKVSVVARFPAAPGKRDELVQAMQAALDVAAGEDGTRLYILHVDQKDADAVWMYEMYDTEEALQSHMTSEALKAVGPAVAPFIGGRPEMHVMTPVGGKGA